MVKKLQLPKIYSLRKLSALSKVNYTTLWHANSGIYNSLSENDRTMLFNTLQEEFEKAATNLGFATEVVSRRIKAIDPIPPTHRH